MLQLTNHQARFIREIAGISKAIGGDVPNDTGEREITFENQIFNILKTIREGIEKAGGFVPKVTKYPDGSKAEFFMDVSGIGIKYTMPNDTYTILHIGENGVTVNDTPIALESNED
jgi:hypothetical protein